MIRILSDLHLAHSASLITEVNQIEPLLEGVEQVVFNGDTVELRLRKTRAEARRFLKELLQLCGARGVEPVLLNGNHDPDASDRNYVDLLHGRVLVTHGDAFFEAISPWAREAEQLRQNYARFVDAETASGLAERLEAARRACLATPPARENPARNAADWALSLLAELGHPRRAFELCRAWKTGSQLAAEFCERLCPAARCVIMGHTHRPGWRFHGGRLVVNTGAFLPWSGRRAVDIWAGSVIVRAVDRRGGRFFPGRKLFRWSPESGPSAFRRLSAVRLPSKRR